MECLHKASAKLNRSAKEQIYYKGPFPSKTIRQDTKEDLQDRGRQLLSEYTLGILKEVTRQRETLYVIMVCLPESAAASSRKQGLNHSIEK